MKQTKPRHQFYTTWYAGDDEESDSWIGYLSRNLHHISGEDTPFHDTSWTHLEDEALLHDKVLDALYKNQEIDASGISILVVQKTVCLVGNVKSEREKQIAEDTVRSIYEVWRVQNDLEIKTSEKSGFQTNVNFS